ncbi:MAG TPA: PHP domain-containing protein [Gemmatimonadales bacterium]
MHCHSTASDGQASPDAVVQRARDVGLAAIALTDHDTLAGIPAAQATGLDLGVRVVPGCEFSVRAPWGEMHLLAYFLPVGDATLEDFLAGARAARQRRGAQMVEKLQQLGVEIDLEDLAYQAGTGSLGRPHVARALVDAGVVDDFDEAFERFLGRGRPAFVEKTLPTLREVADLVHGSRGLVLAAHLGDRGQEPQLKALQTEGLDGIEVRHPSHQRQVEARLAKLARKLDLAVSGGSDWHGDGDPGSAHAPLGGMDVPQEWLEGLEARKTKTYG